MNYEWLENYCLQKPGTIKEYKVEWECYRYMVGGKMFLMDGTNNLGQAILTLKLDPAFGDMLRQQYKEIIIPGYYMNKVHWNSIIKEEDIPVDEVKHMIDESYELIFRSLSKKTKKR